ncbi:hypothetical protein MKW98_003572 [Papaver atlanticum]|uniref:Uncharacterized protein n=1 Tax=Papaver atlanticum TaxID=357466 RepID=A0AAD4XTV0_9MAGN|nr:hypothetical protein MKW98_003572 [Papaver atlanticum]
MRRAKEKQVIQEDKETRIISFEILGRFTFWVYKGWLRFWAPNNITCKGFCRSAQGKTLIHFCNPNLPAFS